MKAIDLFLFCNFAKSDMEDDVHDSISMNNTSTPKWLMYDKSFGSRNKQFSISLFFQNICSKVQSKNKIKALFAVIFVDVLLPQNNILMEK